MKITDMVRDGKTVTFMYFQENKLWYKTECGFEFPVPTNDPSDSLGTAKFSSTDKAIMYMRWIKKHVKYLEHAKENQEGQ